MMKLILAVTLLIAVISLLMNILMWKRINKVSDKRKELKGELLKLKKSTTISLENHKQHIENLLYKAKQAKYAPTSPVQHTGQQPTQQLPPQPIQQPVQQPVQQNNKNGKHGKHEKNKGNNKPQQPTIIKTFYLGINSDDIFFDVEEQKSATSKFVAYLTSENEAFYEPIDVERVRSANVAASLKQSGMVSIKDAQTFNVVEKGKIRKDEDGWKIESAVVVEFSK